MKSSIEYFKKDIKPGVVPDTHGSLFSMVDRVAIVSGGSKGIGRAIANELARAGASITIAARDEDALNATAKEISSYGRGVLAVSADMTTRDGISLVLEETVKRFGTVHTLVNNIGGSRGPGFENRPLEEINDELFDLGFQYNVKSQLWASQLVAPMMLERGSGSIINIASTSGRPYLLPLSFGAVYSMSKAAVVQLTVSMAIEWAPSIRANCIAPGLVMTQAALSRTTEEQRSATLSRMALDRFGDAEDLAGAALFLASDASAWVTGITIDVNGGAGLRAVYAKSIKLGG
jgi:NAD(P)-dependent dehydrogenase (short-subunit alcohol dehydrogenase family)